MRVLILSLALLGLTACFEIEVPNYSGPDCDESETDCDEDTETEPSEPDTEEVPGTEDTGPNLDTATPELDTGWDLDTGDDETYYDLDGDGYSNAPNADGTSTDCDETNPDINPGATEVCDIVDNDCDEIGRAHV